MAIKTKPTDLVVKKWLERASTAVEAYKAGVLNPKRDWAEATTAAADTWKTAIQEAIARGAFEKGVAAAGTKKWQDAALKKGAVRYPEGVRASVERYKAKIAKVLSIIASIELPPRGPRGAEQNYERVKAIGKALHEAKLRGEI